MKGNCNSVWLFMVRSVCCLNQGPGPRHPDQFYHSWRSGRIRSNFNISAWDSHASCFRMESSVPSRSFPPPSFLPTLHTSPEGDPGLVWDSSGNSNRIWKLDVWASKKSINEKNLQRGLHYWFWDFCLFLAKIWSIFNFMPVLHLVILIALKSDENLKFECNMSFSLENKFLV